MLTRFIISRRAQKDLDRVPEYIGTKLQGWIEAVENEGLEKVRKIPGYHDEPLRGNRMGQRSLRLSIHYRAIYEVIPGKDIGIIKIQEVTKHEY